MTSPTRPSKPLTRSAIGSMLAAAKPLLSTFWSSFAVGIAGLARCSHRLAQGSHRFVQLFAPWGFFLTFFAVAIALVTFVVELEDRQVERTLRAWQVVLAERPIGSSQREAFEYLNRQFNGCVCGSWVEWVSIRLTGNGRRECIVPKKQRESLARIEATGANLKDADLRDADLRGSILTASILKDADLRDADLGRATQPRSADDDGRTVLLAADLRGADLTDADLSNAVLVLPGAPFLSGADLAGTNLTRADLRNADLSQAQLDNACGDPPPRNIPTGLKWKSEPCPEPTND